MKFRKMPVDSKSSDYLSPHNSTKYTSLWGDVKNGQAEYIYNKFMLLARKLDAQY